ncbi:MAG: caspase family protein, partial [Pirellulaceae bacterium]
EFAMARPIALDRKGRLVGEDIETHELVIRDVRDGRRMNGITMTGTISKSYSQVVFSPDGRFLATACHDFGNPGHVQIWDFEKGLLKAVLRPTNKSIQQLHFSSDGTRLLVVTFEDAVIVEVGTGETVWTLPGQSIMAAGLSPDGKTVVTKGSKTTTWNAETGKPIRDFGYTAAAPVFSPDGKHLFVNQCLTEIDTNRKVRKFDTLKHAYGAPVFSRDGTRLAIVGAASDGDDASNRTVIVSDVASGRELRKLTFRQVIRRIGLSPDGRKMLVSFHGRAELFDVASGQRLLQLGKERKTKVTSLSELGNVLSKTVGQAVLSPDGRYIAALSPPATTIVIYGADTGRVIRTLASGLELVQTAALSPDGTKLITFNTTLGTKGSLTHPRLIHWDLTRNRQLHNFQGHREVLSAIALTHDGEQLVTGGEDGIPILWDVASGQPLRKFVGNRSRLRLTGFRSAGRVLSLYDNDKWVTWSADSAVSVRKVDRVISGLSADGKWAYTQPPGLQPASIWSVATRKPLATLHSSDKKARWSHIHDISPDRRYLFSSFGHLVFNDGPYLWDARNGRLLRKVAADVGGVNCARFLPNSREVIVSSLPNGTLQSLSVPDGRRLRRYIGHSFWIVDIAFSPGARRMVTGSLDRTAIIWDIATARSLHVLRGHSAGISCVTYGSRGRYVATASHDGVIKVWNAAGGQLRRTLEGHDASVRSLAFDTTETTLASTSDDGTVRLWDVTTGQQIASLVYLNEGKDWLVSTPEGLFDGSDGGRQAVHFRIGNSLHVVPVDRFFQDFYYPGLLESVWNGQRPLPQVTMGESAPPMLRVVSPDRDGSVDKNVVTIEIEVTDQGGGVKGPWVMHNGARVIVRGTAERTSRGVRRKFTLPLIEGKNRIEIRAASADGSWESEPAILNLACNEPLEKPSLFVVSVGVDDYAEADMKLNYAVRDAESLASLFRERGAQLYGDVHVLTVEDRSATRDGIVAAIRHVAFETRPQDTVVLFLAGQGALVGDRYYFLPQDFRRTRATVEESIRSGGMLASEIAEQLATTPALKRLLLFDTCRANENNALTRTSRNPFALRGAIERLTRSEGTFTIAGVATNDKVREVDELKHGVLTYSLLAGLRDVDAGPLKNQWVTTEKGESLAYVLPWFSFASRQMPQLTKKYFGSRQ